MPNFKGSSLGRFRSFRLMFGRAIISRNGLEAWSLFRHARARDARVEATSNLSQATICRETGLKEKPLLPVKKYNSGPVDDDHKAMMESRLKDYVNWIPCDAKDTVRDVGYANGDAFAFTYLGTAQDDLKEDLKWIAPMYSDSDDDDSDHEWTYEKYVAQQRGSGGAGVISDRPGAAAAAGGDADFME